MQTTLRLDDELFRKAKAEAAAQGISLTKLVEEAIRERLDKPSSPLRRRRVRLPVSTSDGGLAPGFSTLKDAVAAAEFAEDRRRAR
jgi:hypothetical protein